MSQIHSHKDLIVWQRSMELVYVIYELTDGFPAEERYGLQSQMRRAGVSIPSNIAEGRRRGTRKDFRQFLLIAYGSIAELETQLEIVKHLKYCSEESADRAEDLLNECGKMLNKLIASLGDLRSQEAKT